MISRTLKLGVVLLAVAVADPALAVQILPGVAGSGLVAADTPNAARLVDEAVVCTLDLAFAHVHAFSVIENPSDSTERIGLGLWRIGQGYLDCVEIRIGRAWSDDSAGTTLRKNVRQRPPAPEKNGMRVGDMRFENDLLSFTTKGRGSWHELRFKFGDTVGFALVHKGLPDEYRGVDYCFPIALRAREKAAIYCRYHAKLKYAGKERGKTFSYFPRLDVPWKRELKSMEIKVVLKDPGAIALGELYPAVYKKNGAIISWTSIASVLKEECIVNFVEKNK